MIAALDGFVFTLSILTGLWCLWMLADWLWHGCPQRFETEDFRQ